MTADPWLIEIYFDWLRSEAFVSRVNRKQYEGVLRVLHDIPFYWTIWDDENRAGDALTFRQYEFLGFQMDLDSLDQKWLEMWACAAPSVLEVLLGIARRWSQYFGHNIQYYFGHLFRNLELDRHPGAVLASVNQEEIRKKVDTWMARQYEPNGKGSPFPVEFPEMWAVTDMREIEIWRQMNVYSAEHFQ